MQQPNDTIEQSEQIVEATWKEQFDNRDKSDLSKRDLDSNKSKSDELKSILVIGDSIIKHIDPNRLSRREVRKFTYRGKTCKEISDVIDHIQTTTDPSHIAEVCNTKIVNLARKVRNKFTYTNVGVSGLTYRDDIANLYSLK